MTTRIAISAAIVALVLTSCNRTTSRGQRRGSEYNLKVAILDKEQRAASGPELPVGTRLTVRTSAPISTRSFSAGDRAMGVLAEPLLLGARIVAPAGTEAILRIVDSDSGSAAGSTAMLTLRLTQLHLSRAQHLELLTEPLVVRKDSAVGFRPVNFDGALEIPAQATLTFQLQTPAALEVELPERAGMR